MSSGAASAIPSVVLGLNAAIIAVTEEQPRVLTVKRAEAAWLDQWTSGSSLLSSHQESRDTLPFALLDAVNDRTLELAVRERVCEQTGVELGYVEQLYTFGDRNRLGLSDESSWRVISVAYLALVREDVSQPEGALWRDCYQYFPWEDWRRGRPEVLEEQILPVLARWIKASSSRKERSARKERAAITFGYDMDSWDGERVLERYELLYELGLVGERHRDDLLGEGIPERAPASLELTEGEKLSLGAELALDHRRILSTALGRIRGKLKYRPVVFELVPDTFTLFRLQRVVESLAGVPLHKQNFRRLVERGGLVVGTGRQDTQTGGRPAELFRFRRDVLKERPSPGVGLPGASVKKG